MIKIQIIVTILLFLVITGSCVLAASVIPTPVPTQTSTAIPTKSEEVPGMVLIKGGIYQMGVKGEQKSVTVSDFYIGKYEVTNKEYCEYDPGHKGHWSNPDYPVETVSWDDAVAYCKWLSNKTGKNYRLPTEAEWEYACRADSTTDFYWGENYNEETGTCPSIGEYAWYSENSNNQVHPVGQKKPNAWGLYDMAGNGLEWCSDWYDSSNSLRVIRGGSWGGIAFYCQSGLRLFSPPVRRDLYLGFRVVLEP